MKIIFFLRGISGSGKSTWVSKNKLTQYTLCADQLRLLFSPPCVSTFGGRCIAGNNDTEVWDLLIKLLEERMIRGEFNIIDATHYRLKNLTKYRDLVNKYGYDAYIVDFSFVDLKSALLRNGSRDSFRFVPESTIQKMHSYITKEDPKSLDFIKDVISPEEALSIYNKDYLIDLSYYDKVIVFGDLHGCYSPLKNYFNDNPFTDRYAYIFVGDYIDRGIQNGEVMRFIASVCNKTNVFLLEGNHEKYLKDYLALCKLPENSNSTWRQIANCMKPNAFRNYTLPQIADLGISVLSQIASKLIPFVYFDFGSKKYMVSHGGLPVLPDINISESDYILGAGAYEDVQVVYDTWMDKVQDDHIMIHGHRNCYELPTQVTNRIFNLCSDIEYGASLRIVEISETGISTLEYPNSIYNERLPRMDWPVKRIPVIKGAPDYINHLNEDLDWTKTVHQHGVIQYSNSKISSKNKLPYGLNCDSLLWDYKKSSLIGRSLEINLLKDRKRVRTFCYDRNNNCMYLFFDTGLVCFDKTNDYSKNYEFYIRDFKTQIKQTNHYFFNQIRACGMPGASKIYTYELFVSFLRDNNLSMSFELPDNKNESFNFSDCHFVGFAKNEI